MALEPENGQGQGSGFGSGFAQGLGLRAHRVPERRQHGQLKAVFDLDLGSTSFEVASVVNWDSRL